MRIHVVQRGESLWGISQQYNIPINQIILINEIDNPDILVIGQALVIPDLMREYVIQPGDKLESIASRYGVTVRELAAANQIMNPSLIYAGQMLVLPYFPHVVRQGESLWSIASSYGIPLTQLLQATSILNPSLIYAGQTIRIPNIRPSIEVNAYATEFDEAGRQEVLRLGRNFTYLSSFMYSIREDGSLTELQDKPVLDAARLNGVAPLLTLTNFRNSEFNSDLAATILRSASIQETLIANVIQEIRDKKAGGINIDFEYVYPEDRENYNAFLRRMVESLHPLGYLVSTAVAPKTSADQKGILYEAHDYKAHGEIVDFVVVMTYEWGWAGGRPWAIAPINEVRKVLDYAVTEIHRDKIMMGIPLYGRDWKIPWQQGTFARTVSPKEAVQLAARYGASIQYNQTYQSPFFRYVDESDQEHEVWFEDARSIQAKYETVKEYGLRGVGYWVLGSPFPQNWPVLQSNFIIQK
ncbi:LysM peptidoglycan-binding domain-containing protein [Oceanobacillus piezotolerans]|uniref:LysM peptidoglycan-binding domain-containing protein n=1 Tax=Oceanobacillus piezotolerans TaxID=2448030 RepID=A0A498D5Q2_9BACI|nr:LysM peptidoglycan-binding domain-containing protein [Oceanobacillus piezotolerans]RLL41985.1 LysM peptidoglycan-binding domain-containing protein [Oceanobacillus piezotolerans]